MDPAAAFCGTRNANPLKFLALAYLPRPFDRLFSLYNAALPERHREIPHPQTRIALVPWPVACHPVPNSPVVVALLTNLGDAPWKTADVESIAEPFGSHNGALLLPFFGRAHQSLVTYGRLVYAPVNEDEPRRTRLRMDRRR